MQPSLGIESVIYLIGIAQGLFLAIVLWKLDTGNRTANRVLAIILVALAVSMGDSFLYASKLILRFPAFLEVCFVFTFVLGPLFLLYVQALTGTSSSSKGLKWLHFVPFLLCTVYYLPLFAASNEPKISFLTAVVWEQESSLLTRLLLSVPTNYYPVKIGIVSVLALGHVALYLIWTGIALFQYGWRIKAYYSSLEKINLSWLRNLLLSSAILWLPWADLWLNNNHLFLLQYNLVSPLFFTLFIFVMGYRGMQQPQIFSPKESQMPEPQPVLPILDEEDPGKKYEKSGLTAAKTEVYLQQLLRVMETEKLYTNPELTLQELADTLSISTHNLSQLLNERLGVNFFDFVNTYRVEAVKGDLLNPRKNHLTILAIALEAGFNSKTAFNGAFKKKVGMSPSQSKKHYATAEQSVS